MDQMELFKLIRSLNKIGVTEITVKDRGFLEDHFKNIGIINPEYIGYSDNWAICGIRIVQDKFFQKMS